MLPKDKSEFKKLLESIYNRYRQGAGFLVGDVVKISPKYKSHDFYKGAAEQVKQLFHYFASECKNNLRVSSLKQKYAASSMALSDTTAPAYWCDVYEELAPGRWGNSISMPVEMIELVADIDASGHPDASHFKHDDKVGTETTKIDKNESSKQTDVKSPEKNLKGVGK